MHKLIEHKGSVSLVLSCLIGAALLWARPFPAADTLFGLLLAERPRVYYLLSFTYNALLFTTPYIVSAMLLSTVYIFGRERRTRDVVPILPAYPEPGERTELFLVVGEKHHERVVGPVEHPEWLTIPERGLFTGTSIFGAIGSGKTTCCMYPFAEQLLAYRHSDPDKRIGGFVLEVKGDFCGKVRSILANYGRASDYVEMNVTSGYCYNPLHNDLEPYALAYGIATLLNSLFGKSREPYWQQSYTNMLKFIILLHRLLYDYVTLLDVYHCAIDPGLLEKRLKEGEGMFEERKVVLVDPEAYVEHKGLAAFQWSPADPDPRMQAPFTDKLARVLSDEKIPHEVKSTFPTAAPAEKREQFQAVKRWFYKEWMATHEKLRTAVVTGVSSYLSMYDDSPVLKRAFCPPKECYEPNYDGRHGTVLPPFSELIEKGAVVAVNFPISSNPGLARLIGTLMKLDFQRAMLERIPQMENAPERYFRQAFFLCDEYHMFATAGESDPTGDEKFFALSRQAKCIPIVATQSISSLRSTLGGESWRTLLQTFRTKIFLTLSDDFTARVASDLCGKDEQLKLSYNFSESGQDTKVSVLTGRATAQRTAVAASKTYGVHRDYVLEQKKFLELRNAQSIVLAYDGLNPLPATLCYLKPYYLDRNTSYFEQLAKGNL